MCVELRLITRVDSPIVEAPSGQFVEARRDREQMEMCHWGEAGLGHSPAGESQ